MCKIQGRLLQIWLPFPTWIRHRYDIRLQKVSEFWPHQTGRGRFGHDGLNYSINLCLFLAQMAYIYCNWILHLSRIANLLEDHFKESSTKNLGDNQRSAKPVEWDMPLSREPFFFKNGDLAQRDRALVFSARRCCRRSINRSGNEIGPRRWTPMFWCA
jgi:hypothetical protein